MLLAYAAVAQPFHRGIRCCVEGSETTFELVYRAAVNDVRHRLGVSMDAQWVVGVTPLMETGCTSASACAETVQNAQLAPGEVGTRHGNSWVIDDLGVSWKISLPSSNTCERLGLIHLMSQSIRKASTMTRRRPRPNSITFPLTVTLSADHQMAMMYGLCWRNAVKSTGILKIKQKILKKIPSKNKTTSRKLLHGYTISW